MAAASAPLIHVGYPKAGSTWLQKQVFPRAELGFTMPWGEQSPYLIEHVKVVDTFLFDEKIAEIREYYRDGLEISFQEGLFPILSYEHIMLDPYGSGTDRRESARRLKSIFPEGKILLVIREQRSIIFSSYTEILRRGFSVDIDRFLGFDELRRPGFGASCPPEGFLYDRLIEYLYSVFGTDNVLVIPIELVKFGKFKDKLFDFLSMQIPQNFDNVTKKHERQARKSDIVLLKHLNKIGSGRYKNKGKDSLIRKATYSVNVLAAPFIPDALFEKRKGDLHKFINDKLSGFFTDSNVRTSSMIGFDLKEMGYM
jgi:hypothetical protein